MNTLSLKIDFDSQIGMGYVQLRIDEETFVLMSDESFDVGLNSEVEIRAIPSYGNVFAGWQEDVEWTSEAIYENEKIILGRISRDTKLTILFEDPSLDEDLSDVELEQEEEIIPREPQYGILRVKATEGGSFMLRTDELSVMSKSDEYVEYSIEVGSSVELIGAPMEGYLFSQIFGDIDWLDNGYGKMIEGEYYAIVEFEEEVIEEEVIEEEVIEEEVIGGNDPSQFLSFGGIVLPSTESSYVLESTTGVVTIALEYNSHWQDGKYLMNGKAFHDLVLIRGVQYKFTTNHDKAAIEILDENYESIDLSTELGIRPVVDADLPSREGGNVTLVDEDLIFTPNTNTPEELTYRTAYLKNEVSGKIHVRSGVYYGRVTAYGYVSGCGVDPATSGTLGEFLIGDDGSEFINPSSTATGTDIHAQIDNLLTYKTVTGATQLNALTTLFAKVGFGRLSSTYAVNQRMNEMLGITFPCDILNDDPIRKILLGDDRYVSVYKKLLILNALLNFINRVNPAKLEDFYAKLAWEIRLNNYILLTEKAYLTNILSGFVNPAAKEELTDVLGNLFAWVAGSSAMNSYLKSQHILYTFGRVFQLDFLEALATTNNNPSNSAASDAWAEWGHGATPIYNRKDEVSPISLPTYLVMKTGFECTETAMGPLMPTMKKQWDDSFFSDATDGKTSNLINLHHIYGKIISVNLSENYACYSISRLPVEFTPDLPLFNGGVDDVSNESIDECCSKLPENVFVGDETVEDVEIFSFKLIEAGESTVMYETAVTTKSHPIEYLGNDEYRLYLDDLVDQYNYATIPEASPGYCVIPAGQPPTGYAKDMEQRYLKVGYNSDESVKNVISQDFGGVDFSVKTSMPAAGQLMCSTWTGTTPARHGLSDGDIVEFSNSTEGKFDGAYTILYVANGGFAFVVADASFTYHDSAWNNLSADVESFSGTKVYCDTNGLEEGDTVVFDKVASGLTFNIDEVVTNAGEYLLFKDKLPSVSYVVKSHVNENQDEVVEFMFTGKGQYYSVAGVDQISERLWLTYDPDIAPQGRGGHRISYIQFFYNKSEWNG